MKPDYSEYLKRPKMLEWIEKEWVDNPAGQQIHDAHAKIINDFIKEKKIKGNVLEVGCGTGNIALRLTWKIYYKGIDQNPECIEMAKKKNANGCEFEVGDVRKLSGSVNNLVFTFGFLKHFGLHEWNEIFNRCVLLGKYFIFDMPIDNNTKDDGEHYHHVWKSRADLNKDIEAAGLELIDVKHDNPVEPVFICKRK